MRNRGLSEIRRAEIDLIAAALADHRGGCAPEGCGGSRLDPCALRNAIERLTHHACQECNLGGHTCPGDGNPIRHGDTDCGEHEERVWHLRTWADVRAGDTVRMPGTDVEAEILTASLQRWHVDPRTGTSGYNPPVPLEHDIMQVRFNEDVDDPHRAPLRPMDPAKPVEIWLTQAEVEAFDAMGWENRA